MLANDCGRNPVVPRIDWFPSAINCCSIPVIAYAILPNVLRSSEAPGHHVRSQDPIVYQKLHVQRKSASSVRETCDDNPRSDSKYPARLREINLVIFSSLRQCQGTVKKVVFALFTSQVLPSFGQKFSLLMWISA
jgi:hypothetical protein